MKSIFFMLALTSTSLTAWAQKACERSTMPINQIQGDGQNSPLVEQEVWVKGVVTGDFRGKEKLGGYFIQSLQPDQNPKTSEGLFINENNLQLPFEVGDVVVTQGRVKEQFGVTQIHHAQRTQVCQQQQTLPQPFVLKLPLGGFDLEQIEGMRVTFEQPMTITSNYGFLPYGELVVSNGMLMNPTSIQRPGPGIQKILAAHRQNQMIVDDGSTVKFPKPLGEHDQLAFDVSAKNPIKEGKKLQAVGVMHYAFGQYKLQPTEPLELSGPLPTSQLKPPTVTGQLSVAAFNVENFFTTLDQGEEICGPLKNFSCRGADSKEELQRQLAKLVYTINTANPTVLGLQELENNKDQSIKTLVKGLNEGAGFDKWGFIDTGVLGADAIKVGLIYQPKQVTAVGDFALLNQDSEPEFLENRNRIIVAQTFADNNGELFNVATVHFKSKSCRDAEGDDLDQQDGQSCYNPVRVQVAEQLANWLQQDPTGQGAEATFVVGDFNAYQLEDPIVKLQSMGFYNLADDHLGKKNWTAGFRGTVGSLDYVMGNAAARAITQSVVQWHINSISSDDYGYNLEALDQGVDKPKRFYRVDPFASSDHDVVIAGFDL